VSVRSSQMTEPTRAQKPLIVDSVDGEGPIVGIRSALAAYPEVAWLVLACDLPFLSDAALEQLLTERDPSMFATAYLSAYDGLPEPLCAVWEPAAGMALSAYQSSGGHCPRKFLGSHRTRLVEPRDRHALDNVNTPEEYAEAQGSLDSHTPADSRALFDSHAPIDSRVPIDSSASVDPRALFDPRVPFDSHITRDPMQLKIQYFALMREQAGRSEETLETSAATPADLFSELNARYGFTLSQKQLKVAVNSEFSEWTRPLSAGDAVVFIPPVAGG